MSRVKFDTSLYTQRAGQIRIVDASSSSWGHINVDDFAFDWDVAGAVVNYTASASSTYLSYTTSTTTSTSTTSTSTIGVDGTIAKGNSNGKFISGGKVETPNCGVVYAYLRHVTDSNNICSSFDKALCTWTEETQLIPSDKRSKMLFGSAIQIDDSAGLIIVGAPQAALTGYYKESMSVYPYTNTTDGSSNAALLQFPVSSQYMPLFQSTPLYVSSSSGAHGVWYLMKQRGITVDDRSYVESGAIYVFSKVPAVLLSTGDVSLPQYWLPTEKVKLQPSDGFARDYYGAAIAYDNTILAVGATGQDGALTGDTGTNSNAGALYVYNTAFTSVAFSQVSSYQQQAVTLCSHLYCSDDKM
jgi:hypothetical protein